MVTDSPGRDPGRRDETGTRPRPELSERWLLGALFPDVPRDFRGRRGLKIVLRALHVACAGVLTGAFLFAVDPALREPWFLATVLTGLSVLSLDLHETFVFLLQLRGLVVLVKLAALAALHFLEGFQGEVLLAVVVVSVISSHAPSRFRYRPWACHGRFSASHSRG